MSLDAAQQSLSNTFYSALQRYHNVDGRGNGSGVQGETLPPGVDADHLDQFMHDLSDYLAAQPGIALNAPPDPSQRAAWRKQIAQQAAPQVSADPRHYIETAIGEIHDPQIAGLTQKAVDDSAANVNGGQSQFFTAPSSSSGRYHPADEINQGGLCLHSLRDVDMGEMLCNFFSNYQLNGQHFTVTPHDRDEIAAALTVHDIEKGGEPWGTYAGDHGPLGESFLEQDWKGDPRAADAADVPSLVGNHMAQWNQGPDRQPDPRIPQDLKNQIVSYADYLAALDDVYVQEK